MLEEKKTIMAAFYRKGRLTIFDNKGHYHSIKIEGEIYNYCSEFVTIHEKRTNTFKVYDVDFHIVKIIDLNSSNY